MDKHVFDIDLWSRSQEIITASGNKTERAHRRQDRVFTTVRSEYASIRLLTIGYGLHVVDEYQSHGDSIQLGFGLKTSVDIAKGTPITQYEGETLSSIQAEAIRRKDPSQASHFATPVKGGPVINGFQCLPYTNDDSIDSATEHWNIGRPGDPLLLPFSALKGKRGGSFANHKDGKRGQSDDGPNAEMEPTSKWL